MGKKVRKKGLGVECDKFILKLHRLSIIFTWFIAMGVSKWAPIELLNPDEFIGSIF